MAGFSILQEAAIPYNGSGTFTLAQAAFVPSTPISSSAMNSDLSDIATNGLTNAITKDGQTTITGALKGASGSVGAPSYSFSADLDSGWYRIGANNIGISVNATKILDIATTGLSVIGAVSPSTTVTNAVGTVLLPSYTFSGDLNSGMYWIGADNIGVGVAGAKVLDISATGLNVVGTVSSNGAAFSPLAQGAGMVNGTIVESHTGNAVTFAIKTLAGADPSASDIVYFVFRNVTAATGNYVVIQVTAALSLTVSSGSTLGTASSNIPFRLWLVAFNDASTVRLGIINCLSGTNIYPLAQFPIASATAEGGAGGADSAQVFYANAAVTSKAYAIIGYAGYETGVTTAGSWAVSPTRLQLVDVGMPLPGEPIQIQQTATGAVDSTSAAIPYDDSIPQIGEGKEFMTQAIVPTSAANILRVSTQLYLSNSVAETIQAALFQDATANALAASTVTVRASDNPVQILVQWNMLAGQSTSTTFRVRAGPASGTTTFNGGVGARKMGGVANSYVSTQEIMA